MTTSAQVQLGVRTGYATETSCKIVVASLADGDVTITGSWGTTTITAANMVAIGAGFVGNTTITGLSSFTRYNFTATQGAKSTSGSFMTAPAVRDDFSLFFAGCDSHKLTGNGGNVTGFWNKVHDYAVNGALETAGVFFVDDHGYVDRCVVDDTAGTGLAVSDTTNGVQYNANVADYAIGYMAFLGMLGDTEQDAVAWGRDSDRVWCNQNLNYLPQWGDHEFMNDFGFVCNAGTAAPISGINPTKSGADVFAAGKAAWDAFFKPLMPTPLDGGYGWAMSLGCVNLIAPDGITNATGDWDVGTEIPSDAGGQIGTLFGDTQIDAILAYVNANPKPFNLFGIGYGIRYLEAYSTPGASGVFSHGSQGAMYNHVLTEYQRLFTGDPAVANPQPSLMKSNYTNGVAGSTILLHGDYHHACVLHHQKAAYADNLAENFYSVHLGTINGSTNFSMPLAEGASYDGTTLEYTSGWTNSTPGNHNYAGMRIDVYGSRSRPELYVTLMDSTGATMWAGKWMARSSNEALDTSYEVPSMVGTSVSAKTSAI